MPTVTLRDLYAAELHDLMNAEKQILAELPVWPAARRRSACDAHSRITRPKPKYTSSAFAC